MALSLEFSRKQKIVLWISIPLAFLIHRWVSVSQEVGRLTNQLKQGPTESRVEAAYALGRLGSSADKALDALSSAVRDPDAQLRRAATTALIQISRRDAVGILTDAFSDRDPAVRLDAAEALDRIGTASARAALEQSEQVSERRYQRAQLGGWVEDVRRKIEKDKKERYRRHKRVYGQ